MSEAPATSDPIAGVIAFLESTLRTNSRDLADWQYDVSAAVGALRTARTRIPAGYVLVPAEPTEAMLDQGEHVNSEWLNDDAPLGQRRYREPAKAVYIAMIAAAREPKP